MSPDTVRLICLGAALSTSLAAIGCAQPSAPPPEDSSSAWAYPIDPPAPSTAQPRENKRRVSLPGTEKTFTLADLTNLFAAPDWRPSEHPPMPPIVARGRKPAVMACGFCHLPTGDGRPENAALAGLPRAYIIEQMRAFRSGTRRSSVANRAPTDAMGALAKAATDAEIAAAATYFASLTHHGFTDVVQTDQVPATQIKGWIYTRAPTGGVEPIGARIIEMPNNVERFEQRDPVIRYTAYVPPGSIARGAELARTWGEGRLACASCHGSDFRGTGIAPPLAGRSPTYIVRQLNDMRAGARGGPASSPMKPVVASMQNRDMIALASFLASRRP